MTLTQRIPIEIQFAQGLAGNEQKNRDKTLSLLKKFIRLRLPRLKEPLKEDEFIKLWKGMHYQLWMQDKPLIQEKLVEDICQLVHDFHNEMYTLMFIKTFFDTEAREWFGLDQWRMNKFMMLIREFLHNCFLFLKNSQWKESACQGLSNILEKSIFSSDNPIGLQLHLIDIFPTELQKVADEKLSSDTAVILLFPFLNILPTVKNGVVMKKVLSLLFESSGGKECPKEENARERSYRPCGFAERDPTKIKETKLQFSKELLLKQLVEKGSDKKCSAKNRNLIYNLVKRIRYLETHPQKPIKMIKDKDVTERDVDVPDEEIIAAAKKLREEKEKLLKKVPTRKEYKRQLVIEKKSKKASKAVDINEVDTEEEMEDDDGEDGEDDVDSLDYDHEAEFLRLPAESDDEEEMDEDAEEMDEDAEEMDEEAEELSDDASLPIVEPVEDEVAESKEQENLAATKKNKKSQKAGSKRKSEEPLEENVTPQVPEKKAKNEKTKKKVSDNAAAAAEKMEVELVDEGKKKKKRKRKSKKKGEKSSKVSETEPVFGMVDFPEEEEEEIPANESIDLSEVVVDVPKSAEEDTTPKKKKNKKKAKKVKQTKKSKKSQVTEESQETDDESDTTAELSHFPLPTNAKDCVDISNIQTQNTLHLFEHLKKMKQKENEGKTKRKSKSKKKVKSSHLDRYFNQIQKEVSSIEKMKKSNINKEKDAPVNEEKDSPVNEEKNAPVSEEEVAVTITEVEAPVEKKKKTKAGKKSKKVVKSKPVPIIKPATQVKTKPEKAEPELDVSERLEKLHQQPPAFLRNAMAKVGKPKKGGKKKSKAEESASIKKSSSPQGSKRVSFDMNQNIEFEEGSEVNQDAFQPSKKPENGILKPSISPIRISKKFSMDKKLSMLSKQSYVAHFF